jgi:CubicO group peptidase (beta-lactamase class C family)
VDSKQGGVRAPSVVEYHGVTESKQISDLLRERIKARDFPSAVYLAAEKGEIVFSGALGSAVAEPETIAAEIDTIYDLASLTKPLITGLLCARLLEKKKLDLAEPIAKYFGQFSSPDKDQITVQQLLTHTSGFAAWKPFYLLTGDAEKKKRVIELIAAEPLLNAPDTKAVYSDLNFLMLGFLLEKIYGERLDGIAASEIFLPLGVQKTFFDPPAEFKHRIAASERGNAYEKQTCIKSGYDISGYPWREEVIWGEVHDGNAYFLDGIAAHAGLFSTAAETLKIARQFLAGPTELLAPETCRMFHTNFTPGLNEARSLSFELAATENSTAGDALAKNSFGHLGFTGTSLWIEPETERVLILLTNRTHARELPFANLNRVRRTFHGLAINALKDAEK